MPVELDKKSVKVEIEELHTRWKGKLQTSADEKRMMCETAILCTSWILQGAVIIANAIEGTVSADDA